jgi:hypothetical protein
MKVASSSLLRRSSFGYEGRMERGAWSLATAKQSACYMLQATNPFFRQQRTMS